YSDWSRSIWLGNSQLHAINQSKDGDRSAPELLHAKLRASKNYPVTFSQPSANLQEQLALFAYLQPRLAPKALILPVVFDDFRETGLRAEIQSALKDEATASTLRDFAIGRDLIQESRAQP